MGLDWFSVSTEAYGGGTPDLFRSLMFGGIWIYIWEEEVRRWSNEGPMRVEGAPRGGARPLPRGLLGCFLTSTPSLLDHVCSKNHAPGCLGDTWIYIGGGSTSVEQRRAHEGGGRAQGVGVRPYLVPSSLVS